MKSITEPSPEVLDNLRHGQIVIITARWLLILAGWVLTLWQPELPPASEMWRLAIQVTVLFAISVGNFYLTVNYLRGERSLPRVVFATSAGDFAVITILILALGGFDTSLYVFYFPALLAISVAFPTGTVLLYTAATIVVYAVIALASASGTDGTITAAEGQGIVMRLVLMAAVAYCGDRYRRLEKARLRRVSGV